MSENTDNKPTYNVGDELTVMRGLDRGKVAKVLGVDTAKGQYAVQFTDGGFSVVNFVNTKPPVEGSVTASRLAEIVGQATDLDSLVALLGTNVDGFAKAYDAAE